MIEGVCAVAVWCVMGMVMNDPIRSIVIVIRGAKFDQRLDVNQRFQSINYKLDDDNPFNLEL